MLRKDGARIWIGLSMTVVAGMAALSAFLADVEGQTANVGSVAPYSRVEGWPQRPPPRNGGPSFGNMTGVAVDAKGFVYAARRCPGKCGYLTEGAGDPMGSILVWDPGGKFVREWKDVVHETLPVETSRLRQGHARHDDARREVQQEWEVLEGVGQTGDGTERVPRAPLDHRRFPRPRLRGRPVRTNLRTAVY